MKRVVITGFGGMCPLGDTWKEIATGLAEGRSCIARIDEWDRYPHLHTRLGAPLPALTLPSHFTRKRIRSMGRLAKMATLASERALQDANLLDEPILQSGEVGVAYGSSTGSPKASIPFVNMHETTEMKGVSATTFLKMMPHTCAANIGLFFGLRGRVLPTTTACTSGSLAIGTAYEAIKYGQQTIMLAGGAEELTIFSAVVFDVVYATSRKNDQPNATPRPFDSQRDGLVLGEGACTLILEEREHAIARGADIYAEIIGFGTNSDGHHVVQPSAATMQEAMRLSLKDADVTPAAIGYVNAHATATTQGDVVESQATYDVFGADTPVSSIKGHIGHTLGASGALEAWFTIQMMRQDSFAHTLHLHEVDPKCAPLDYIKDEPRALQTDLVMSNNFAFAGLNTSLIFWRGQ